VKRDESFIHRYYDETSGKKIQFHFGQLPALSVVLIADEQFRYGEKPTECFSADQGIIISIIREMNMKYSGLAVAIVVLMMSACGNKSEQEPSEVTASPSSSEQDSRVDVEQSAPSPAIISQAPVTTEQPATDDASSISAKKLEKTESPTTLQKPVVPEKPKKLPEIKAVEKPELAVSTVKTPVPEKMEIPAKVNGGGQDGVLGREEGLALANKSGCLACHRIETKLVGPAWRDVSKRYQSDPGAKAHLISKVKSGGKGNWTDVTGGIAMPPYSPRVSDGDIEKLVLFILSQ